MKKLIGLMLLCATIFGFASCTKDSATPDIPKDVLLGKWVGVEAKVEGEWYDISTPPLSEYLSFAITFYSDGTYYGEGTFGTGPGTYTLNGNTIKTYVDGDLYLTYKISSWTETTAKLTISDGYESMQVKVEKRR